VLDTSLGEAIPGHEKLIRKSDKTWYCRRHKGVTRMEDPISLRWGLVGTSGFADRIFAPALKQAGQVLVGAAGSTVEHSDSFAERHECPNSYASVEDLLNDPNIDVMWVASPNYLHEPHIASALTHGKHVLAENLWR
jgi:hypothetical protein